MVNVSVLCKATVRRAIDLALPKLRVDDRYSRDATQVFGLRGGNSKNWVRSFG